MVRDYETENWVDWCPGCGNFGILSSMYRALDEMELEPERTVVVSGIGCSGKTPHFIDVSGVHTIHGRAIPFASGIKMADPGLNVMVNGGDGDLLGIGAGHFVALGRRNLDITVFMHDNRVYGLTKGQAAPTLSRGEQTKALSTPNLQDAVPALPLALNTGYSFVARGYAMDSKHLKDLIVEGVEHDGAAFIDILQPCITYNDIHTSDFYKEHVEKLSDDWDPVVKKEEDKTAKTNQALRKISEEDKISTGVFYKDSQKPAFRERLDEKLPGYLSDPPALQKIEENDKTVVSQDEFKDLFEDNIVEVKEQR